MRPRRAHLSTPDRTGKVGRAETVSTIAWLIGHVADAGIGERRRQAREQLDRLSDREREVAVAIGLGSPAPRSAGSRTRWWCYPRESASPSAISTK